jgi:hypothetical protein
LFANSLKARLTPQQVAVYELAAEGWRRPVQYANASGFKLSELSMSYNTQGTSKFPRKGHGPDIYFDRLCKGFDIDDPTHDGSSVQPSEMDDDLVGLVLVVAEAREIPWLRAWAAAPDLPSAVACVQLALRVILQSFSDAKVDDNHKGFMQVDGTRCEGRDLLCFPHSIMWSGPQSVSETWQVSQRQPLPSDLSVGPIGH